jgi:DNA-binding Lrp family transcriptional regulator
LKSTDLVARGGDDLIVGVGVTPEPPAARNCLGQQHPHPLGGDPPVGCLDHQVGELGDDGELLLAIFLGEEPGVAAPTLDEIDLEIMEQLQEDGRLGFADLGERVGLSLSSCRARVNRLIESGAMQIGAIMQRGEDTASGLPFGFGFGLTGDDKHLVALLETHPGCEFIARTIGRFDLVATIWFPGLADFNAFLTAARALEGVRITEQWLHVRIRQERYQYSLHRIRNGRLTQAS